MRPDPVAINNTLPSVGVDDSSASNVNNWLGSSVGERPSRIREVPGSTPGLAYPFSSYTEFPRRRHQQP